MSVVIDRYCQCGAALHVKASPPEVALGIARSFDEYHVGEGHGPATRAEAAAVRRREDELARLEP